MGILRSSNASNAPSEGVGTLVNVLTSTGKFAAGVAVVCGASGCSDNPKTDQRPRQADVRPAPEELRAEVRPVSPGSPVPSPATPGVTREFQPLELHPVSRPKPVESPSPETSREELPSTGAFEGANPNPVQADKKEALPAANYDLRNSRFISGVREGPVQGDYRHMLESSLYELRDLKPHNEVLQPGDRVQFEFGIGSGNAPLQNRALASGMTIVHYPYIITVGVTPVAHGERKPQDFWRDVSVCDIRDPQQTRTGGKIWRGPLPKELGRMKGVSEEVGQLQPGQNYTVVYDAPKDGKFPQVYINGHPLLDTEKLEVIGDYDTYSRQALGEPYKTSLGDKPPYSRSEWADKMANNAFFLGNRGQTHLMHVKVGNPNTLPLPQRDQAAEIETSLDSLGSTSTKPPRPSVTKQRPSSSVQNVLPRNNGGLRRPNTPRRR